MKKVYKCLWACHDKAASAATCNCMKRPAAPCDARSILYLQRLPTAQKRAFETGGVNAEAVACFSFLHFNRKVCLSSAALRTRWMKLISLNELQLQGNIWEGSWRRAQKSGFGSFGNAISRTFPYGQIGGNGGHLVPPRDIKISDISMKEAFQRINFWLWQVVSWIACDSNRYRAMIRLSSDCALFIVTVTTITLFQVRHRDWGINTLTGCTSRWYCWRHRFDNKRSIEFSN